MKAFKAFTKSFGVVWKYPGIMLTWYALLSLFGLLASVPAWNMAKNMGQDNIKEGLQAGFRIEDLMALAIENIPALPSIAWGYLALLPIFTLAFFAIRGGFLAQLTSETRFGWKKFWGEGVVLTPALLILNLSFLSHVALWLVGLYWVFSHVLAWTDSMGWLGVSTLVFGLEILLMVIAFLWCIGVQKTAQTLLVLAFKEKPFRTVLAFVNAFGWTARHFAPVILIIFVFLVLSMIGSAGLKILDHSGIQPSGLILFMIISQIFVVFKIWMDLSSLACFRYWLPGDEADASTQETKTVYNKPDLDSLAL